MPKNDGIADLHALTMLMTMNVRSSSRPGVIDWFEILSVVVLGFQVMVGGVTWGDLFWVPLNLWIIHAVTRRRNNIARWIFSAFCIAGFVMIVWLTAAGMLKLGDLQWTGWVLSVANFAQLTLLWLPVTSAWLASSQTSVPSINTSP